MVKNRPHRFGTVRVGRVLNVRRHPNADRLFLAEITVGGTDSLQVIFGGELEVPAGSHVAVALPGAMLPTGERIRKRNYRGVRSEAEMLSADELGWQVKGRDAVMLLGASFRVGSILVPAGITIDLREHVRVP